LKKASIILLAVFLAAAAFLGGFFAGRTTNRSQIQLTQKNAPTLAATTAANTTATAGTIAATGGNKQEEIPIPNDPMNINTATALELSTLPGIGSVIAQRIVDYRQANGPFRSIGELTEVEGIGDKRLENLLELITVGG